ncbi:MAG TPA: hypothetical protein DCP28_36200 [Cytophagales bacterium]|nr:hypothetical protein [Cytophagales bacterium]
MESVHYLLRSPFGEGTCRTYTFGGLQVNLLEASLNGPLYSNFRVNEPVMEFGFVAQGTLLVHRCLEPHPAVVEAQESYQEYLQEFRARFHYLPEEPFRGLRISFNRDFLDRHQLQAQYGQFLHTEKHQRVQTQSYKTQEIIEEMLADPKEGTLKRLFLESRVLELMTIQLDHTLNADSAPTATDQVVKKVHAARALIERDLATSLTIPQIARQVGLNEGTLKREFKKAFGQGLFEHGQTLRMEKACEWLVSGTQPIYAIAEALGYQNATHFTHAFKKHTGITPSKYRRGI